MEIRSENDVIKMFEKINQRTTRASSAMNESPIKSATILTIDNASRVADIQVVGLNTTTSGVKLPQSFTSVTVGDSCLVFFLDAVNLTRAFILAVY